MCVDTKMKGGGIVVKKSRFAAVFAFIMLSVGGASALEVGVPFGFGGNTTFGAMDGGFWGSDIGVRLHFSSAFAMQPTVSVGLMSDYTHIGLNLDALFYLFESNGIRQYLGINGGVNVTESNNGNFRLGGIFGLQHPLAPAVDLFGQLGLGLRFDPERLYTVNTQLGVIFYIIK
jgi:hypothetical protein